MGDLLAEFLLDLVYEGWLPHPFVPHLSEKCAWCGATADRAIHDRHYAAQRGLVGGSFLTLLSGRDQPQDPQPTTTGDNQT